MLCPRKRRVKIEKNAPPNAQPPLLFSRVPSFASPVRAQEKMARFQTFTHIVFVWVFSFFCSPALKNESRPLRTEKKCKTKNTRVLAHTVMCPSKTNRRPCLRRRVQSGQHVGRRAATHAPLYMPPWRCKTSSASEIFESSSSVVSRRLRISLLSISSSMPVTLAASFGFLRRM